jgi:hypothetical protein
MGKESLFEHTKNKNKDTRKKLWNSETQLKEVYKLV